MKILFVFPYVKHYDSRIVREEPCGGTEKSAIFLGEALSRLGHEVEWVTTLPQFDSLDVNWPDVVIAQQLKYDCFPKSLFEYFPAKTRKVWLLHHFSDQPVVRQSAAYGRCFADVVVTLSECQKRDIQDNLRIPSVTIGHGVWLDEVCKDVERDPYRLIYASTPFRGLERIPELFSAIREREPRATISICSSFAVYGTEERDAEYQALFKRLGKMEGVELKGSLNQADLYREYARASYFLYPCIWAESYCIALDEALAHECIPIVSAIGALQERVWGYCEGPEWVAQRPFYHYAFDVMLEGRNTLTEFEPRDWMDVARQWEKEVLG